jgi:hypothetical protein
MAVATKATVKRSARYPGTEVQLTFAKGETPLTVKVYPIGIRQLRKFTFQITTAMQTFASSGIEITQDADGKINMAPGAWKQLAPMAVDIIIRDLLDLVEECVRFPEDEEGGFDSLFHWHVPLIVEAWIKENFDSEEKLNPWIEAVQTILSRLLGEQAPTLNITSLLSSLKDTINGTSSTSTNSTKTEDDIRIVDGPSEDSGT